MSDIERAIRFFEDNTNVPEPCKHYFTALTVLRAEQARQSNEPTCAGCKYEEDYSPSKCLYCERNRCADNYEPKGATK